jgi:hypothetical protein
MCIPRVAWSVGYSICTGFGTYFESQFETTFGQIWKRNNLYNVSESGIMNCSWKNILSEVMFS